MNEDEEDFVCRMEDLLDVPLPHDCDTHDDSCSYCLSMEDDPSYDSSNRHDASADLWREAKRSGYLHLLSRPGGALVRYHGPDPIDLEVEDENTRELILEMATNASISLSSAKGRE